MSFKIWVKQLKPAQEEQSSPAYAHHSLSMNCPPRKIDTCVDQQQAVRRYICKLRKRRQGNTGKEISQQSDKAVLLDNISSEDCSKRMSFPKKYPARIKLDQSPINSIKRGPFLHSLRQNTQIKYVLSEPSQFLKKNNTKNVIFQRAFFQRKEQESPPKATLLNESLEGRRSPRELNLNRVIQKYQSNMLAKREQTQCQRTLQSTPFETPNTERNDSWGATLTKIRDQIEKAKMKYKNCDIKISRIDTDHIALRTIERKAQLRRTDRAARHNLETLQIPKNAKQGKARPNEGDFNPWSTEEIRLSQTCELYEK